MLSAARLAAFSVVALALAPSALAAPAASANSSALTTVKPAPTHLRGFLLRPDEAMTREFPRTPSFAWSPVSGARCYEFELATSKSFTENSLVWSNVSYVVGKSGCRAVKAGEDTISSGTAKTGDTKDSKDAKSGSSDAATAEPETIQPLRMPAVAVDVALPWFTGQPYALYAHVRAITSAGPSRWSSVFSFNMRWPSVPEPLPSQPGLVRWTPVEGATGYQVWYPQVGKVFTTTTNVADEREFYVFHNTPEWMQTVEWRVRAVRRIFGTIPNGLPAVSYGPWTKSFTATNPAFASGPMRLTATLSDKLSNASRQTAHELMPAFTWAGDDSLGLADQLFRAYVFTDSDCVNMVFRGAVVGSPAYAPRATGPLMLPTSTAEVEAAREKFLRDTDAEPPSYTVDAMKVVTNETVKKAGSTEGKSTGGSTSSEQVTGANVELPDAAFPATRYYWTVVPVGYAEDDSKQFKYFDLQLPQDVCADGRIASFGKESEPVATGLKGRPYVSGLSTTGRLLSARRSNPTVYGTPLVSWLPATGADGYEVQWSRSLYPWRARGSKVTYATSALLPVSSPGRWYYRVRGLNSTRLAKPQMQWSAPVALKIAAPTFKVVG